MTAAGLADRFAPRTRNRGMGGLVLVAIAMVAVVAAARTEAAERVFADWLAAALPGAGFAVAGAVLGYLYRDRPLLARTPASLLALVPAGAPAHDPLESDRVDRVAGAYGAAIVSPVVLVAAVVAFSGDDRPILVCCWLLTALCAAIGAGWAALPVLRRVSSGSKEPVGSVRVAGTPVGTGEEPDGLAVVAIALRAAAVGTGVAALATGALSDSAVSWVAQRPAVAAAYAVVVALVAAPGAEAGCFASGAFVALGPAAVVGFAATAAVCDVRFLRMLQRLVGRGTAWRTAVAAVPVLYAGAVWSGVMLR